MVLLYVSQRVILTGNRKKLQQYEESTRTYCPGPKRIIRTRKYDGNSSSAFYYPLYIRYYQQRTVKSPRVSHFLTAINSWIFSLASFYIASSLLPEWKSMDESSWKIDLEKRNWWFIIVLASLPIYLLTRIRENVTNVFFLFFF